MQNTKTRPVLPTLLYGAATVALYVLLFEYSELLVNWAYETKTGNKLLFIVPVAIAFVFSYFHGAFTGYFWESIGLRAAASHKK